MPRGRTDADIEAIATDAANDATSPKFSEMEGRIDDLEKKNAELQAELAEAKEGQSALAQKADEDDVRDKWQKESIDRLFENDRTVATRLGIPFQQQ